MSQEDLGSIKDRAQKYNNEINDQDLTVERTTGNIKTSGFCKADVAVNFTRNVIDELLITQRSSIHIEQVVDETTLPVLELKDKTYKKVLTASTLFKFGIDINSEYTEFVFNSLSAVVEAAVFSGVGLDDATSGGTFSGSELVDYLIEIDGAGTPDTFKWSKNGGATWIATTVAITGAAQVLDSGVTIAFAATTGHTLADQWTIKAGYGSATDKITVDIFLR